MFGEQHYTKNSRLINLLLNFQVSFHVHLSMAYLQQKTQIVTPAPLRYTMVFFGVSGRPVWR